MVVFIALPVNAAGVSPLQIFCVVETVFVPTKSFKRMVIVSSLKQAETDEEYARTVTVEPSAKVPAFRV